MKKEVIEMKVSFDDQAIKALKELEREVNRYNRKVAKAVEEKSATLPFMIAALEEAEGIYSKAKTQLKRIHLKMTR